MPKGRRRLLLYLAGGAVIAVAAIVAYVSFGTSSSLQNPEGKPVILYINQGNGAVNQTNFGSMLQFANSQGFNTVFFQVCRLGDLLFGPAEMKSFVSQAHASHVVIFFAVSFNTSSFRIPQAIYGQGEDGISLDMSNLYGNLTAQENLLGTLKSNFGGETAVTVYPEAGVSGLKPTLLVLETYTAALKSYIKPGVVGSVEVAVTTNESNYKSQVQYALQNSDGVMVFDYAGLQKRGY